MENNKKLSRLSNSNLVIRILSSVVLLPIILFIINKGENLYFALMVFLGFAMLYEWIDISKNAKSRKFLINVLGLLYVSGSVISLLYLRNLEYGVYVILWLFLTVVSVDVGCYFFGNIIGGKKILPSVSPNKTWSGLFGGVLFAFLTSCTFSIFTTLHAREIMSLAPLIAIISQVGDFAESKFKRVFNVKDSGNLIPGHGGVLDRVDGLVFAAMFLAAYYQIAS